MSNIPALIRKKRDGEELSTEEIDGFVAQVVKGTAQDSQIGAMLMAMYLRSMSDAEVVALTAAMVQSGDVLEWDSDWNSLLVDKHSTGGVGDKISLVLAPALAACGFKVPMVSGRGLEFTGGTLDKMESIPGFRVQLSKQEMDCALSEAGCFIAGATSRLAPADMVLYKTRDVTATVDNISLIAASIVSKKVAEGTKALVMDIKVGSGAFFKNIGKARELADKIIRVSSGLGLPARALITRMETPLGFAVGNALEVAEAVDCLHGNGPTDVLEVTAALGGILLQMKGFVKTLEQGKAEILKVLTNGQALQRFQVMLECQGVDKTVAAELCNGDPWKVLPSSPKKVSPLLAPASGKVTNIDAISVAIACWHLGAGRSVADMPIEPRVGVVLAVKVGESVVKGQPWVFVHHIGDGIDAGVKKMLDEAIVIVDDSKSSNANDNLLIVEIV